MEHLGRGLMYKEIAHSLRISANTVKQHVSHIYRKLDVPNAAAALVAMRGEVPIVQRGQQSEPSQLVGITLRFAILQRDGFRCRYCGRASSDGVVLHVDHVVPLAAGGTRDPANLVTACDDCNLGKGGRPLSSPSS